MIYRKNIAFLFISLIVIMVSFSACIIPNAVTNNSVTVPLPFVDSGIVPDSKIKERIIDTVQVVPTLNHGNQTQIRSQQLEGPISLTINSAKKQYGLGKPGLVYSEPIPGNVFLVLNISVKNKDAPDGFNFRLKSIHVRNVERGTDTNRATYIRESLREYLENPITPPITIQQHDTLTGEILFDVNDTTEYRVNLGENKSAIASQRVYFDNLMTTENPVSFTINSAKKVSNFTSSNPMPGHIFLILNVTVKNNDIKDGFAFSWESTNIVDLRKGDYAPHSLNNGVNLVKNLEKPLTPETLIKQNNSITGEIIFGIADSTEYRLNLLDNNKTVIASRNIHIE